MLTRKHYRAIADIIRETRQYEQDMGATGSDLEAVNATLNTLTSKFVHYLLADNPRFLASTFIGWSLPDAEITQCECHYCAGLEVKS
jgi:hypothetical protein